MRDPLSSDGDRSVGPASHASAEYVSVRLRRFLVRGKKATATQLYVTRRKGPATLLNRKTGKGGGDWLSGE
ncbi:hypothetical protein B296_00037434 [Ensete ventricosum]|uniref:Uncharacterized protein n=1 Tax=Ensete ventricosum TaxID=4639 RepID=A0A426ZZN6_ENSVE|nr:hypothetical protein B296_00037434 [Ensete ventricosum]